MVVLVMHNAGVNSAVGAPFTVLGLWIRVSFIASAHLTISAGIGAAEMSVDIGVAAIVGSGDICLVDDWSLGIRPGRDHCRFHIVVWSDGLGWRCRSLLLV